MPRFSTTHPRKVLNGTLYRAHSWFASKSEAKRLAKEARQRGNLARVVKFGRVWAVYVR